MLLNLYDTVKVNAPDSPNHGKIGLVHDITGSLITVYIGNNPNKEFHFLPSQLEVL